MKLIRCDNCDSEVMEENPFFLRVDKDTTLMGENWPKHFCSDKCITEYFTKEPREH